MQLFNRKIWVQGLLATALLLILPACSSSDTKDGDDEFGEPETTSEAKTDVVPEDSAEAPPGMSGDDSSAPLPITGLSEADAPPPSMSYDDSAPPALAKEQETSAPPPSSRRASTVPRNMGDADSYVVKKGDTLMKIAFETYGDLFQWRKIYEHNRDQLKDPNSIPPGTTIKLERGQRVEVSRNGDQYLIKKGDTLGTISNDVYGTPRKWKRIWENNKELIHDPNKIFAGFYVYYSPSPGEMKQNRENKPAPLAKSPETPAVVSEPVPPATEESRDPASVPQPAPQAQPPQPQQPPKANIWERLKKWK